MNKTVNSNIGGLVFHIDEDAYQKLNKYFEEIKRSLSNSSGEDETLTILITACGIAIESQVPELVADKDKLEEALDMPTINRILEVCGGIKLDDPNLLAAAVLAGQNSI